MLAENESWIEQIVDAGVKMITLGYIAYWEYRLLNPDSRYVPIDWDSSPERFYGHGVLRYVKHIEESYRKL